MARKEIQTIKPNTLNLYSIYDVALVLFYIKAQYSASELTIKRYQVLYYQSQMQKLEHIWGACLVQALLAKGVS